MNPNRSYSPVTPNLGQNRRFFSCVTLKNWQMTLKSNISYFKLFTSFRSHLWIQAGVIVQSGNARFGSKSAIFVPCYLGIRCITLKNNRAPLLCYFKLCSPFRRHRWIKTGVTVWKLLNCVLSLWLWPLFDLWLWLLAWSSLLALAITPGNLMMIRWWEHGEKGVTDGRQAGWTDGLDHS